MMLRPSEILKIFQVSSPRDFASRVYKEVLQFIDQLDKAQNSNCVLSPIEYAQFFSKAFHHQKDANECVNYVKKQLQSLEVLQTAQQQIFLPPTFLRASVDLIVEVDTATNTKVSTTTAGESVPIEWKIILVLCKQGPVVPVIIRYTKASFCGNDVFRNCLMSVLTATSPEFVDQNNIAKVLRIFK